MHQTNAVKETNLQQQQQQNAVKETNLHGVKLVRHSLMTF